MRRHRLAEILLVSIGIAAMLGIAQPSAVAPSRAAAASADARETTPLNAAPLHWFALAGANKLEQATQALDFFPGIITIDAGDSITWTAGGNAHTVTFLGPFKSFPPNDNPAAPYGGNTYNGSALTSSGFLPTGKSYTLTFPKIGVFPYQCLFHDPEMAGYVVVQPKGAVYPHTQAYYNQRGDAEADGQLEYAFDSLQQFPFNPGGRKFGAGISPNLSAGNSRATVLRFINSSVLGPDFSSDAITVPLGATLTWVDITSNEPHTVTFPIAGHTPPPNLSPFHPPIGGPTYDGTALVHSGPLFPGQSYSLKFTHRGIFLYYCLFHDAFGMIGKVTVR